MPLMRSAKNMTSHYQVIRNVRPLGAAAVDLVLERDRIHGFGADPLIQRCKGSMSALIEPAGGQ